jgi:hypothetical protein
VPGDDPFHQRKSDAAAWELVLGVQPLEHMEELVRMAHVKPGSVVGHRVHRGVWAGFSPDLNPGLGLVCSELDRVSEEIDPDLTDHGRGSERGGQRVQFKLDFAFRMAGAEFRKHVARHLFHVNLARLNLLAAHSRKLQQVIDQVSHPPGLAHDDFQKPVPVRVQLGAVFGGQNF